MRHFFLAATLLIGYIILTFAFSACSEFSIKDEDSPFLKMSTYRASQLTEEDYTILEEAESRLTILEQDGFYYIQERCGQDVNISEELYQFIRKGYKLKNQIRSGTNIARYQIPRTKSMSENTSELPDCVFYAILNTGSTKLNSPTYYTIKSYAETIQPDWIGNEGFTMSEADDIITHFVSATSHSSISYDSSVSLQKYIVIVGNDEAKHALNATRYVHRNSGSDILDCIDYWRNTLDGTHVSYYLSEIKAIYY